jgi:hypothetical protein
MSENSIDYEKGLTFEKVWASIQELGKKQEAAFEKYEREAAERAEKWRIETEERRKAD